MIITKHYSVIHVKKGAITSSAIWISLSALTVTALLLSVIAEIVKSRMRRVIFTSLSSAV